LLRLPDDLARVDALLDDPVFFAPFVPFFHPVLGRPSTPVECYLRLMFLKFRYRLGFESLCAEVSDSISWRRFCRIPLDGRVPHPTTLMKLTTRCGEGAVAGLNEALWAKAAGQKLVRTGRVRADTTVICANVAYPTDSGLLAKAVGKLVRTARRVRAAGGATATTMTDRRRAAARRVRRIASTLRTPGKLSREESSQVIRRVTGELAGLADKAAAQAAAVVRNGRRAVPRALSGRVRGGWYGRWMSWRSRLSAPPRSWPRPAPGWLARHQAARPGWSACMIPMPGQSARGASTARWNSGIRPRSPATTTASSSTTASSWVTLPTPRSSCPPSSGSPAAPAACRVRSPATAATACQPSSATCTTWACAPSRFPARPRPHQPAERVEHSRPFHRLVKWRTGSEGRISYLKRRYGWDRTWLDGRKGATIWCGHGVFAHNLVKLGALAK
jgi:transposase, IS5 family